MKTTKPFLLAIACMGFTVVQAQNTVCASGGNASSATGNISYSVGQIAYTTNTSSTGSVAQGVQQPYEISVLTGTDESAGISLLYTVYPNPVANMLTFKVEGTVYPDCLISLFDINGKLLRETNLISAETKIDMSPFVTGAYLLAIRKTGQSTNAPPATGMNSALNIKTFKIIKY